MGFGINRVVVSGRLCKDPELRATRSGLDVMTVRLATEDRKKGADGAWVDDASYLDVVSFGGAAAAPAQPSQPPVAAAPVAAAPPAAPADVYDEDIPF